MLKKLQSLKAKKGFTLVELIVVIAIIAVLAAILVPTMMGYVTQSRVTSADTTAQQLKDTVGNAMVQMDTKGYKVPVSATVELGLAADGTADVSLSALNAADGDTPVADELVAEIEKKINEDYTFTKDFTAVVHIKDREAVACAYCADANADLDDFSCGTLQSGIGNSIWENTEGITSDGYIIGTFPKMIMS